MPKTEMEILSQQIGDDDARYRIRVGKRVYYLTIPETPTQIFDEDTLCEPHRLLPKLPKLPEGDWNEMLLTLGSGGHIETTISYEPLAEVTACWHPRRVDILTTRRLARYNSQVSLIEWNGEISVAKLAPFPWEIPRLQRETVAYERIANSETPQEHSIAPRFLGHLTENGRVIGFLMERIEGRAATLLDLPQCAAVLRTLHSMGMVHGDINKHNFVVELATGRVRLVDFEYTADFTPEEGGEELQCLEAALRDESGLGAEVEEAGEVEVVLTEPTPVEPYIFEKPRAELTHS